MAPPNGQNVRISRRIRPLMPIPIGWRRGSRGEKKLDSRVLLALRQFPRLFLVSFVSPMKQPGAGGGADQAGVASQEGVTDLRLGRGHGEGHLANVVANALQEGLAG